MSLPAWSPFSPVVFSPIPYRFDHAESPVQAAEAAVSMFQKLTSEMRHATGTDKKTHGERGIGIWQELGVRHENFQSFSEQVGKELCTRLIESLSGFLDQLEATELKQEKQRILQALIGVRHGDKWYALHPQTSFYVTAFPGCATGYTDGNRSLNFMRHAQRFLENAVQRRESGDPAKVRALEMEALTGCLQPARVGLEVHVPAEIRVESGHAASVPIRFSIPGDLASLPKLEIYAPEPVSPLMRQTAYWLIGGKQIPFKPNGPVTVPKATGEISLVLPAAPEHASGFELPLTIRARSKTAGIPWQTTHTVVRLKRQNQAPIISLNAPSVIMEGTRTCIGADYRDPDRDPVQLGWKLLAGEAVVETEEPGRFCVTPTLGDGGEKTLQVQATAVDAPADADLPARQASASATIRVYPKVSEHAPNLPPEAAKILNEPSSQPQGMAFASDSHFYILLRLSQPIEHWEIYEPSGNFKGEYSRHSDGDETTLNFKRSWSEPYAISPDRKTVVMRSPIEPWEGGKEHVFDRVYIDLRSKSGFQTTLKVIGKVSVPNLRPPIEIRIEKSDIQWGKPWTYRLHLPNAPDASGTRAFKANDTLDVSVHISSDNISSHNKRRLALNTNAKLVSAPDAATLTYEIGFFLPESYAASPNKTPIEMYIPLSREKGQQAAEILYRSHLPASQSSSSLLTRGVKARFSNAPLPSPWFMLETDASSHLSPGARLALNSAMDAYICPKPPLSLYSSRCTNLHYPKNANERPATPAQSVTLPLGIFYQYDPTERVIPYTQALRRSGGHLKGFLSFLIEDPTLGPETWKFSTDVSAELPGNTSYAFKASDWIVKDEPEITDKGKEPDIGEDIKNAIFRSQGLWQRKLETVPWVAEKGHYKAGDTVRLTLKIPVSEKQDIVLEDQFENFQYYLSRARIEVTEAGNDKMRYRLNRLKGNYLGKGEFEITLTIPQDLPSGQYSLELSSSWLEAHYRFYYGTDDGVKRWSLVLPVSLLRADQLTPKITVEGNQAVHAPQATGGLETVEKPVK